MIIRIMGEGQFELPEASLAELNEWDAKLEAALASGDEPHFRSTLATLLALVRTHGSPVADEHLVDSESILPPADASVDDVRELLGAEGLIPD